MVWGNNNLIPRPSHCPVFDHLQFAKTEGGRPGPFYHVTDVSVDLCRRRWGEVLDQKNEVEAISGSFCLITGVLNIHEVKNILLLVLSKECLRKMDSFDLFAIKNWMVGRPGNKG